MEAAPGVSVSCETIEGGSTQVLLEQCKDAELLVVGARGHGGFIGLVLGSVSDQCARHAHIPVVVVPAPHEEPLSRSHARAVSGEQRRSAVRHVRADLGSCPRSSGARSPGSSSATMPR